MALTLTEAEKLSTDILLKGIIETIIKDSPVLQELPFIQIVGNALKYVQENVLPTVAFYAPNATSWTESAPTFTEKTATLTILGGDADVDNFLKSTRSNVQDIEAAVIEQKAKALRHKFEDTFVNGNGSDATNDYGCMTYAANSFDGLYTLIRGTTDIADKAPQEVAMATTYPGSGGSLTLGKMDELIDAVKGGKPDLLLMSRRSRRSLQTLSRAAGSNLEAGQGKLGDWIQFYNGIPIAINDWIADNMTVGTATDCSVIYAIQMGEAAVCGLSSPELIQVERLGSLETKDASRTRVKWYCSLALFSTVKAAMLTGVRP